MPEKRWMLVVHLNNPTHVKAHWMDSQDLAGWGIKGRIGEEFQLDDLDDESKYRIVGEITGRATDLLNAVVGIVDLVNGDSQELRFDIFSGLVEDVVRAVNQAKELEK